MDVLIEEAKDLANRGVKELIISGSGNNNVW